MAQIIYTIFVVLNFPRTVAGLIAFAELIVQKMTGNSNFPTATATLTAASNAITAYQATISSSSTTKGLKGQRTGARNALLAVLKQLRDIVRLVAEASPENALAIVESAGMSLKKRAIRLKALISVVDSGVSGTVICRAKAPGIPTNYFWFYSLDNKSWTSVPQVMKSKLVLSGLTPGQVYYFRYYTMNRRGTSDLSQVFSLLVK